MGSPLPQSVGVQHGKTGASPEAQVTPWNVRVTEVRPGHLVCLQCVAFKLNSCSDVLTSLPASTRLAPDHPLQSSKSHLSGTNHSHYSAHNPPEAPTELLTHFKLLTMVQEELQDESPASLCSHPSYCSLPQPRGLACSFSVLRAMGSIAIVAGNA